MKNFIRFCLLTFAAIAASCSDDDKDILTTVPEDSDLVIVANVDKIVKNAGCKVVNGVVTLSPDLQALADRLDSHGRAAVNQLVAAASMIDTERVILFSDGTSPILTFKIVRKDVFESTVKARAKSRYEESGVTYYFFGDITLAIEGNQGWFAESDECIKQAFIAQNRGCITANPVVYEFLGGGATIAMMNTSQSHDRRSRNREFKFFLTKLDVSDNTISGEITAYDKTGEKFDWSQVFAPIDRDITKYIPDNSEAVLVFGKIAATNENIDLIAETTGLNKHINGYEKAIVKGIGDYLTGSTAIAVAPFGEGYKLYRDPTAWDCTLVTSLTSDCVSTIESFISLYSFMGRADIIEDDMTSQNCIELHDYGDIQIFYGPFEQYYIGSTRPINDSNSRFDVTGTDDTYVLLRADVPFNSRIAKALKIPYGFSFTMALRQDHADYDFYFNGSNTSVLKSLVEILRLYVERKAFDFEAQFDNTDYEP